MTFTRIHKGEICIKIQYFRIIVKGPRLETCRKRYMDLRFSATIIGPKGNLKWRGQTAQCLERIQILNSTEPVKSLPRAKDV